MSGAASLAAASAPWLLLPPTRETAALMRKDAALLLATTHARGNARGLHGYRAGHPMYSHSCSQFAVLGAWAAEQLVPDAIPPRYWQLAEAAWLDHQDRAGGWGFGYGGWKVKPQVQGRSNGARELMLLVHGGDPRRPLQRFTRPGQDRRRPRDWGSITAFLYGTEVKEARRGEQFTSTGEPKLRSR